MRLMGHILLGITLMFSLMTYAAEQNQTDQKVITLTWQNFPRFFNKRYFDRAPGRFSKELAERNENQSTGFHFDPILSGGVSKNTGKVIEENQVVTTGVSQGSPWGSELSYLRSSTDYPEIDDQSDTSLPRQSQSTTLTLKQKLLKDGLLYGWSSDFKAGSKKELDLLEAKIEFDKAMFEAFEAFISVQQTLLKVGASQEAYRQAKDQNRIVKELVSAGYKAKADTLVSDAAEIKASLQLSSVKQTYSQTLGNLESKLWQTESDEPIAVSDKMLSTNEIKQIKILSWPNDSPLVKKTRLLEEVAKSNKDLAERSDMPSLDVSASMTNSESETGVSKDEGWQKSVGLSISFPLVSSIRRDHSRVAAIQHQKARYEVDFALRDDRAIENQLRDQIELARKSLETSESLFTLEKKTLEIEKQKYSDGKSTVMEIRRAQNSVDSAAIDVIAARGNYILAKLKFARDAGFMDKVLK